MLLKINFKVEVFEAEKLAGGVARLAAAADPTFLGYDDPPQVLPAFT